MLDFPPKKVANAAHSIPSHYDLITLDTIKRTSNLRSYKQLTSALQHFPDHGSIFVEKVLEPLSPHSSPILAPKCPQLHT